MAAKALSELTQSGGYRAAVLGDPVEHSLSPILHESGFAAVGLEEWSYGRIRCPEGQLSRLVRSLSTNYVGLSVTMPGKGEALTYATEVTDRARLIGSANTLIRISGRPDVLVGSDDSLGVTQWRADNTDGVGLLGSIGELLDGGARACSEVDRSHRRVRSAVVVGNGGTARAALWALAHVGCQEVIIVARSSRAEQLRPLAMALGIALSWTTFEDSGWACADAELLISTVPSLAAEPYIGLFSRASAVCDVIYAPWPTPLISRCLEVGTPCVGGITMLFYQALSQFEQFTGREAPSLDMRRALESAAGVPVGRLSSIH